MVASFATNYWSGSSRPAGPTATPTYVCSSKENVSQKVGLASFNKFCYINIVRLPILICDWACKNRAYPHAKLVCF